MAGRIILTGDRPTGRLHIGHYVGSLKNRVAIQNAGGYEKMFVFIADAQALTDNFDNPDKIHPVESLYNKFSKSFEMTFKPNSFTILRVKTK